MGSTVCNTRVTTAQGIHVSIVTDGRSLGLTIIWPSNLQYTVYQEQVAVHSSEISVKQGDTVETAKSPLKGYIKVGLATC